MTSYSKYNIVYRLQKWMDSVPGQTFLNYAYSWGASIVILGTLFKLTHLPGANLMLFFGMGTEVVVFFLSAFDRPFDKTADGMDLPSHVSEEYLDANESKVANNVAPNQTHTNGTQQLVNIAQQQVNSAQQQVNSAQQQVNTPLQQANDAVATTVGAPNVAQSSPAMVEATPAMAAPQASPMLGTVDVAEATSRYIDELNKLTETLEKVSQQSARLTRDSEEMENLNRTLTGISKVYEMQLKSASQQIGTIDQINDQSRRMAQQIEQLNAIYARMIEAMTVNMKMQNP
ncbi:gliding motility protein GldL [Hoylesella shahii]|uniref:type IX secretion system motor protein PorL/GldL n=1 Tax=Hoylesella shahii TaxID=228603 RepID=UPI001CB3F99D|nr:gliding motility protein GldL [Hoylesella shahii]MBF1575701.1 gliding motility protein GldL [Hoylesella shahii]